MQGEEEIASLFASIVPEASSQHARLAMPTHITASRDWSLSCLARVITDRVVFDDNFITQMIGIWGAHPGTRISPIARNTYLIDFVRLCKGDVSNTPKRTLDLSNRCGVHEKSA